MLYNIIKGVTAQGIKGSLPGRTPHSGCLWGPVTIILIGFLSDLVATLRQSMAKSPLFLICRQLFFFFTFRFVDKWNKIWMLSTLNPSELRTLDINVFTSCTQRCNATERFNCVFSCVHIFVETMAHLKFQ